MSHGDCESVAVQFAAGSGTALTIQVGAVPEGGGAPKVEVTVAMGAMTVTCSCGVTVAHKKDVGGATACLDSANARALARSLFTHADAADLMSHA